MSEVFRGNLGDLWALEGSGESVGVRGGHRVRGVGAVGVRGTCGLQSGYVGVCENQEGCEHL